MPRVYNTTTVAILNFLSESDKPAEFEKIKIQVAPKISGKDFYNYLFRLAQQDLIHKTASAASLTQDGARLLKRLEPDKDGVWKLVIFDIPEKHKYVRAVLRAKLKQLHFKKWQNSIWASPYEIDEEIESEFRDLGKKFFVRLIKTTEINNTEDLNKMFE